MCLDSDEWYPYDDYFAEREDSYTDFRGDLIDRPTKKRRILEDADVGNINVSSERYEYVISSIVARNHDVINDVMLGVANPQDSDSAFTRDDDFM